MPASLEEWVDRLHQAPLPAMALTIQQLSLQLEKPSSNNTDHERIIARDPGFTLSLFRAFESRANRPKEPLTNLAHAISLLGVGPLYDGNKSLPVLKETLSGSARDSLYRVYSQACHAASFAYHWGVMRNENNPEEMAVAALLHNCGEMALWTQAPDTIKQINQHLSRGISWENSSLAVLGCSMNQLSQALSQHWQLPQLTADALEPTGAFQPRSLGVMLANALAEASADSWYSPGIADLKLLIADYLELSPGVASQKIHAMAVTTAKELFGLPLPLSATSLIHPAIEEQDIPEPQPAPVEKKPAKAEKVPKAIPPASATKEIKARQKPAVTPNPPPTLQESVGSLMKQLIKDQKFNRVMFALMTQDKKQIKTRMVIGAEKNDSIRQFKSSLGQRHLISLLMSKPQGFWLTPGNRKKYLPLIPNEMHKTLNIDGFYLISLFIDNKPIGLLYADKDDPTLLTDSGFHHFKEQAQHLCHHLSKRKKATVKSATP